MIKNAGEMDHRSAVGQRIAAGLHQTEKVFIPLVGHGSVVNSLRVHRILPKGA
ncbi:hypothetical protein WDZ92_32760 [Nostoc sp. NIES-2111]